MDQLLVLDTGRTTSTRINSLYRINRKSYLVIRKFFVSADSLFVRTVDELCIGNGKGCFTAVFRPEKQLGVTHTLIQHCLDQFAFYLFITWYFAEFHCILAIQSRSSCMDFGYKSSGFSRFNESDFQIDAFIRVYHLNRSRSLTSLI